MSIIFKCGHAGFKYLGQSKKQFREKAKFENCLYCTERETIVKMLPQTREEELVKQASLTWEKVLEILPNPENKEDKSSGVIDDDWILRSMKWAVKTMVEQYNKINVHWQSPTLEELFVVHQQLKLKIRESSLEFSDHVNMFMNSFDLWPLVQKELEETNKTHYQYLNPWYRSGKLHCN